MRTLIVEDDFTSRKLLQKLLFPYGEADIAVNGEEAIDAFRQALDEGNRYNLICLDIMMPGIDGQQVLKAVRAIEKLGRLGPKDEVKIIMTTALNSPRDVIEAYYNGGCSAYMIKPIEKAKLIAQLKAYDLID